ncbi:DUF6441 family protein [Xanthobacter aminoxidans]|uniref:DUF6441 family protein n=1 Tax=Xanthobacter aminoxidans TaxID=186280 RepID=UPI00372A86CA
MRLTAALVGNLETYMAEEAEAAAKAVTSAMQQGADGLKGELRGQVTGAGLGERLGRTWRGQVYPRGQASISAAALVWTKAPMLIDAFDKGALIRSREGFFLAIPTAAAGPVRGSGFQKRLTPGAWERRTGMRLRFVYRRGGISLLVADNARVDKKGRARANTGSRGGASFTRLANRTTSIIFLLVPQARLRKRLDVKKAGDAWIDRVPGLIFRNWK